MCWSRSAMAVCAIVIVAMIVISGCNSNHKPLIAAIDANPADSVVPGGEVMLKVFATDADGDQLTCTWTASAGTLSATTGDSVYWTAPGTPGSANITVVCEDGNGGTDTKSKIINVRSWHYGNVDETFDGPISIPNPGSVVVNLDLSNEVPSGALADSVWITVEFDPDTVDGEYFEMVLITPAGREILFWDNRNGPLDVDDELIPALINESVKGNWRLKIVREVAGEECVLDAYNLNIDYRW
ncbi:MAG: Ig-like domain-containing protein [bacterium]